jgi:1-acyl-sn-glycerol-3-phosphate acyltransferase
MIRRGHRRTKGRDALRLGVLTRAFAFTCAVTWYVGALVVLAVALPVEAVVWTLTAPFDRDRLLAGRLLRVFGSALARIFPPWRVRIEGRLPPGPFVLAANHRSWLDIFVLARLPREMKWVTKAELFRVPWLGWLLRMSADIPVLRGDAESGAGALTKARGYLDHGIPVVFFPEGTRSRDGALRAFKGGAFEVAASAGVPVVPVAITGTAQGMPPDTLWIRPSRIVVKILEPVRGDSASLRAETRARIAASLAESSSAAS